MLGRLIETSFSQHKGLVVLGIELALSLTLIFF